MRPLRALLMPSFAERFGMPVTETISLGVPVLRSKIAALRGAGGAVPDYLDPLDGTGWMRAICDYAGDSAARMAQGARMALWNHPNWQSHIRRLLQMTNEVAV